MKEVHDMYEIKEKTIDIEKHPVEVFKREVVGANILEVIAGTNGYHGGDSGHGSRTYISIKDLGGSDIMVKVIPETVNTNGGVEIVLGGDSELNTFIRGLKFAVKVLEDQVNEVFD